MTYSANAITPQQIKKIAEGAIPSYLWKYKITHFHENPYTAGIYGVAGSNQVTVVLEMPAIDGSFKPFARVIGNHVKLRGMILNSGLRGKHVVDTKIECDADYMPVDAEWFPGRNIIGTDLFLYDGDGAMLAALSPPESQGSLSLELRKHPKLQDPGIVMFELADEFFVVGNMEDPYGDFIIRIKMTLSEPLSNDIDGALTPGESDWYLIENQTREE